MKKFLNLFLVLFLVVPVFLDVGTAVAAELTKSTDFGDQFITNVSLTNDKGETISSANIGKSFRIRWEFNIPYDKDVKKDDTMTLNIPEEIQIIKDDKFEMNIS